MTPTRERQLIDRIMAQVYEWRNEYDVVETVEAVIAGALRDVERDARQEVQDQIEKGGY